MMMLQRTFCVNGFVITPLIDMLVKHHLTASHFAKDCIILLEACNYFFVFLDLLFSFSAPAAADQEDHDRRNNNDNKDFTGS